MMVAILWLGVYPQPLMDTAAGGLGNLHVVMDADRFTLAEGEDEQ